MHQKISRQLRIRPSRACLLYGALLVLTASILVPQVGLGQAINPLESNPRAAAAGGSLFRAQCATCHGADARGIAGIQAPDLTQLWSQPGKTDESVFQTIRNGVAGSIMPPHSFTDTEIWMLVSYLKSTGGGNRSDRYEGDAARGGELFAGNCSRCHRIGGSGGSLGPDLTRITARRSKQALVTSVRDPSASIARGFRPVTLVTRENQRIQGTIKSEDAFSIQVMDSDQSLRGFQKSELNELRREQQSLMPSFNGRTVSDSDLEHILSFLATQSGQR
jgi:putative heme-binding domain-containing protein